MHGRIQPLALVCAILVAASTGGAARSVFAQPAKGGTAGSEESVVAIVEEAVEHYKASRFREAAELFSRAFELSQVPNQLRNAAKAYQDGEMLDEALPLWRRYVELSGLSPTETAEAKARIAQIEQKLEAEKAREEAERAKADAEEAERAREAAEKLRVEQEEQQVRDRAREAALRAELEEQRARESSSLGAYLLMGGGGASVIAGAILFFHANGRLGALDEDLGVVDNAGKIVGTDRETAQAELRGVNTERNVSAVLVGVGGAAVVGGVLWLLMGGDGGASPEATAAGISASASRNGAFIEWATIW